jgi:subtilisin family serine protease
MSAARAVLALLLGLFLSACAALDGRPESASTAAAENEGTVLVMIRAPMQHFRGDAGYGGAYVAEFGRESRRRIAESIATQYDMHVVDSWLMPALGVDCFVMQAANKAPSSKLIEQLSADPRIESAQLVNQFHVLGHNDPLYPLQPVAGPWHLSDLHRLATGKTVKVAQVDTGVDIAHADLEGQVALSRDFVDGRFPAEAHGTAVAGIIAARADNGAGIAGVAPDASLLALRACWEKPGQGSDAVCSTFTVAKALQFALERNAQVINLSIGGPQDRLLERLIDVALARGISVLAADGETPDTSFPASHRGVLAVAAVDEREARAIDLLAPGRDVPATLPGGKWGMVTGSSFATAEVSGLVALLRELSPLLSTQQLREALAPAATSRSVARAPGVVDACAAVARIAGNCACSCTAALEAR